MNTKMLKKLKTGEQFRMLVAPSNTILVKGKYDPHVRQFWAHVPENVNVGLYIPGYRTVIPVASDAESAGVVAPDETSERD